MVNKHVRPIYRNRADIHNFTSYHEIKLNNENMRKIFEQGLRLD